MKPLHTIMKIVVAVLLLVIAVLSVKTYFQTERLADAVERQGEKITAISSWIERGNTEIITTSIRRVRTDEES